MARVIETGDLIRTSFVMRANGQNGMNVRAYRAMSVAGLVITDQDAANALYTAFSPEYRALLSNQAMYQGVIARIEFPDASQPVKSTQVAQPGLAEGDMMAPQVAGLIRLSTAVGGRIGRGRAYIPSPLKRTMKWPGPPLRSTSAASMPWPFR